MRYILIRKIEELKSGHFWTWECERENDDGSYTLGFIDSDGHNHVEETFEAVEE